MKLDTNVGPLAGYHSASMAKTEQRCRILLNAYRPHTAERGEEILGTPLELTRERRNWPPGRPRTAGAA